MFGQKNSELHTWVDERLSDFIDNQLAPAERARVENHLAGCAQCRASLESMRWTIALVKQAPAPVTNRSFLLPVPARREQSSFAFGFARFATALATLLLCAVIGIDLISQFGGAPLSAPAAMRESDATQSIAFAPTKASAPTAEPKPVGAMSSAAPLPPAPAAVPPVAPTATAVFRTSEVSPTQPAVDTTQKSNATQPTQPPAMRGAAAITATVTATATVTPTQTATPMPPTATPSPTSTPTPVPVAPVVAPAPPMFSPLRIAQLAFLFATIFFGTLTLLLWRQRG